MRASRARSVGSMRNEMRVQSPNTDRWTLEKARNKTPWKSVHSVWTSHIILCPFTGQRCDFSEPDWIADVNFWSMRWHCFENDETHVAYPRYSSPWPHSCNSIFGTLRECWVERWQDNPFSPLKRSINENGFHSFQSRSEARNNVIGSVWISFGLQPSRFHYINQHFNSPLSTLPAERRNFFKHWFIMAAIKWIFALWYLNRPVQPTSRSSFWIIKGRIVPNQGYSLRLKNNLVQMHGEDTSYRQWMASTTVFDFWLVTTR